MPNTPEDDDEFVDDRITPRELVALIAFGAATWVAIAGACWTIIRAALP